MESVYVCVHARTRARIRSYVIQIKKNADIVQTPPSGGSTDLIIVRLIQTSSAYGGIDGSTR